MILTVFLLFFLSTLNKEIIIINNNNNNNNTNVPKLYRILFIILIRLCIHYADRFA